MKPFIRMHNVIFNRLVSKRTKLLERQQLSQIRKSNSNEHKRRKPSNKPADVFKQFVEVSDCGSNSIAGVSYQEATYWLVEKMRKEMMQLSRSISPAEICIFTQISMEHQVAAFEQHKGLQLMRNRLGNYHPALLPIESSINSVMSESQMKNWKKRLRSLSAGVEHGTVEVLMEPFSQ